MPTLPVPHREQAQPSDCLAACAAMVLDYLGQSFPYPQLLTFAPQRVPRGEFELAWLNADNACAVVER